jgi:YfiH family protein
LSASSPDPRGQLPPGIRRVRESGPERAIPVRAHPEWRERFPWLVQGTTAGEAEFHDLGLFGRTPVEDAYRRWRTLREVTGMGRAVHSLQVHGAEVLEHRDTAPGLFLTEGYDGHVTGRSGVLLTVSVADCVPISLVDPDRRRVALLHGGWRGTAAGIVARGLEALGSRPGATHAHLGPGICGDCYEVGPEVHEALGLPSPSSNLPIDLRAVQARRLVHAGVPAVHVTISEHCTRCGPGFFSHRGDSNGRQLGVLGIR